MDPLIWQIPLAGFALLGILRITLAPYWLHKQSEQEKLNISNELSAAKSEIKDLKDKWFFPLYELDSPVIKHRTIRISDLTRHSNVIEGKEFENCSLYGPAILYFTGNVAVQDNQFETPQGEPKNIFFEIEPGRPIPPCVVVLRNSSFRRCQFFKVGIVGTAEVLGKFEANAIVHKQTK